MGVEFIDKTGQLRPYSDYRDAYNFYAKGVIQGVQKLANPEEMIHGVVVLEVLKIVMGMHPERPR